MYLQFLCLWEVFHFTCLGSGALVFSGGWKVKKMLYFLGIKYITRELVIFKTLSRAERYTVNPPGWLQEGHLWELRLVVQ